MHSSILIIGAGFGGLWSALSAVRLLDQHQRLDITVTVLAPQAELHVRPRFYEHDIAPTVAPLAELFDIVGINFVQGCATAIDADARRVSYLDPVGREQHLGYDRLILASGSQVARPAVVAGINQHTFDVDSYASARRLGAHLHALPEQPDTPQRNTVVVVGGGFTGIETATEMPGRLRAVLGEDADVRVVIIDRGQTIGGAMGQAIGEIVAQASDEVGLTWRLGASVQAVDAQGVTLAGGERIEAGTVIWAVGVKASPLTEHVQGERDPSGRLHVDNTLKVQGQAAIFATGNTAFAASDELGNHALMTCQHAIALGRSAGNNAAADLLGVATTPYSQVKYVTCLDLGAWGAVYTEGWDRQVLLTGQEGKTLKTQINTQWIYPPAAHRANALAAADPLIPVVA
ncbi:FAD-dependent oxidoreductase [Pseudomonas syringae]|nr:FAD-dependent oxidoreductase [Pseudomonas syringae]